MKAKPDQQISLTDPDSRSMATSGRGSGVVGYNVQVAVEAEHHLIVTHEVTNVGNDRAQLAPMAKAAKNVMETETLDVIADRGYFDGEQIKECIDAGVTVTLPKPQTSGAKAGGRFGKQDFAYLPDKDVYRCPANQLLPYHFTTIEKGMELRRYWSTAACQACQIKEQCTTGKERRITRWVHEHLVEEVQRRLDANPDAMRTRRETVEHPFGTIKARMGATHFLMKRLHNVAAEMALHVLAYNLTRVMNIIGKVEGKSAIVLDDMVDTAGTLVQGAEALVESGAKRVLACATHPVLSGPAIRRLEKSEIEQLVVTNTIPLGNKAACKKIQVLSVAPLLGEAIKRIHSNDSVSSLFV